MSETLQSKIRVGIDLTKGKREAMKKYPGWSGYKESIYNGEKNYAILTGEVNDIVVVDLDKKEELFKGLEWFESKFGKINEVNTLVTRTLNSGYHIYFKYNKSISNRINMNNINVDILSDKKCVFEGEGYSVVSEKEIRELTDNELQFLTDTGKDTTTLLHRPECELGKVCYKKINTLMNKPVDTVWDIEKQERGLKATPICNKCLVNPCKEHSESRHSALFINNDKTVVKTCFSCGSDVLDRRQSKKVINVLNVIMNVKDTENTIYQQLITELVEIGEEGKYRREKGTGVVYKQIKGYAYMRYKNAMDFLNEMFYGDKDFKSHVANMDNLIKFMKQYDDPKFPFLEYNKEYIGFRNGVLNVVTCEFNENPEGIVARKYIDQEFNGSKETPLMDKVLDQKSGIRKFLFEKVWMVFV